MVNEDSEVGDSGTFCISFDTLVAISNIMAKTRLIATKPLPQGSVTFPLHTSHRLSMPLARLLRAHLLQTARQ